MKTKIVYVACSLNSDCYLEQAFISAWSVRQYNKDCQIIMVCDQDTYATFGTSNRQNYKYLSQAFNGIKESKIGNSEGYFTNVYDRNRITINNFNFYIK